MKKLLFIISCLSVVNISSAQSFSDNFDNYTANEFLCPQSNNLWTTWDNNPGGPQDAIVTNEISNSGNNSVKLMSGASTHIILPLGNVSTGKWELSFMMRIESEYGANFNMLHELTENYANTAFQTYFSESGSGSFKTGLGSVNVNFTHPTGEWFEIKLNVDIDGNHSSLSIDGNFIGASSTNNDGSWPWFFGSLGRDSTIAALQLYPRATETEEMLYYIDDVTFHQTDLSVKEPGVLINLYPNPTLNRLMIES